MYFNMEDYYVRKDHEVLLINREDIYFVWKSYGKINLDWYCFSTLIFKIFIIKKGFINSWNEIINVLETLVIKESTEEMRSN